MVLRMNDKLTVFFVDTCNDDGKKCTGYGQRGGYGYWEFMDGWGCV